MPFGVKVGHFVKAIGTAPSSQSITGVGFQPKAVLFWTMGGVADAVFQTQSSSPSPSRMCIGAATSSAAAEQFSGAASATLTGFYRRSTARAICLLQGSGAVNSECLLTSMDSDGFTLNWTINDTASIQIISYLALGGSDVQGRMLTSVPPFATGNFSTTGTGFTPNLLITFGSNSSLEGGVNAVGTLRMGAAVSTTRRWAFVGTTAGTVGTASTRVNRSDRAHISTAPGGFSPLSQEIDFVSFNSDGVTLNNVIASQNPVGLLCLKVPFCDVGTTTKPTIAGPAVVGVTGLTFTPRVVLLSGVQALVSAGANDGARGALSAFTTTASESTAWSAPNAPGAVTYSGISKAGKAYVKVNNDTPVIDSEATSVSMDGTGFTLNWNANDSAATEFNYLAIGDVPIRPSRRQRKVYVPRRRVLKPRGAWRRRTL